METEKKTAYQEVSVAEQACSMASYLFLRYVFGKEEFSETVTEEFQWIVDAFGKAQTEPALLQTLWCELVEGPYMSDDDPRSSVSWVKGELIDLGHNWTEATSICQVLHKMWGIYSFITDEKAPMVQLWKTDDKHSKMVNNFTRMMDFQTGHIEPYYYVQKTEGGRTLVILTPDCFVGTLCYDDESVIKCVEFDHHIDRMITDNMKEFARKLIGRKLQFPCFQEDIPVQQTAMAPEDERLIAIAHGTKVRDELTIWKTNAPDKRIRELGYISTEVYMDGGDYGDLPDLHRILTGEGYSFQFVGCYINMPTSWNKPEEAYENSKKAANRDYANISAWYYTGPWN